MKSKEEKGITLIALVVTIIVLIILAGVSINLVFGNLGIVTKAKEAKRMQEQAELNEQIALRELSNEMDKEINETGTPTQKQIKTVEELKNAETYMTEPTTLKDSNENLIKVPKGFKIAEDSGKNVTEGIVIEDNDIIEGIGNNRGNQYIWIPIGIGIKKADGTTVDITLGRYTFADGKNDKASDGTTVLALGTPILQQSAENYKQEVIINPYKKELPTYRQGVASSGLDGLNTTALNLNGFIDSAKKNGGYYIARYEASYGTDGKANSKVSNSYSEKTAPTTEGTLWNFITQINAAKACYDIYEANYTNVTTDLINSYAWDTAIVYIQNFSEYADYSYQTGKNINSSLTNTGINKDEKCKINDMASNTHEWTTEYSTFTGRTYASPCTARGGYFGAIIDKTCQRLHSEATISDRKHTFRPILYI